MQRHKIVAILILISWVVIGVIFILNSKKNNVSAEDNLISNKKTYSQGQWDGVNVAIKYLQLTHQIDSVKLDVVAVDSLLTLKEKERN